MGIAKKGVPKYNVHKMQCRAAEEEVERIIQGPLDEHSSSDRFIEGYLEGRSCWTALSRRRLRRMPHVRSRATTEDMMRIIRHHPADYVAAVRGG